MANEQKIAKFIGDVLGILPDSVKDPNTFKATYLARFEVKQAGKTIETGRFSGGKGKIKPLPGPGAYSVTFETELTLALKSKKTKGFANKLIITWNLDVEAQGNVVVIGRPTEKVEKMSGYIPIDSGPTDFAPKSNPTSSGRLLGVRYALPTGGIITKAKTFTVDLRLAIEAEKAATSEPVKKKVMTASIGSFPTGVSDTKKVKKFTGALDIHGLKKFCNGLPEMTQDLLRQGKAPGGKPIELIGFTDSIGASPENYDLGIKRAADVGKWMTNFIGVTNTSRLFSCRTGGEIKREDKLGMESENPSHRRVEIIVHTLDAKG